MKTKQFIAITFAALWLLITSQNVHADAKYPVRITDGNLIVFPQDENTLEVIQILEYTNGGSNKEEKLPIYLPKGYTNLEVREGLAEEDMQKTDKGIIDTSGLEAGEDKQIVVYYTMPLDKDVSQWTLEQAYVIENIQIIIQPGILSLQANELVTQSELFELDGKEYRRFTRLDLHPDTPWPIRFRLLTLSGTGELPVESPAESQANPSEAKVTDDGIPIIGNEHKGVALKVISTFSIVVIAFWAALIGLRRDWKSTIISTKQYKHSWLLKEKELLLEQIYNLEKDYRAKLISETTYNEARDKIRTNLVRITSRIQ